MSTELCLTYLMIFVYPMNHPKTEKNRISLSFCGLGLGSCVLTLDMLASKAFVERRKQMLEDQRDDPHASRRPHREQHVGGWWHSFILGASLEGVICR